MLNFNRRIASILIVVLGLTAQGMVFAEASMPSCYLAVIGCQMQNCPAAKSMHNGTQKMDCCKPTADKNTHSDAVPPVAPKNGAVQGLEFTDLVPSHDSLDRIVSSRTSELTDYESPHTPEPLYEKNQDLRI